MNCTRPLTCALALGLATPATADITAADLWEQWQSRGAEQGQEVAADEVIETETGLRLLNVTSTLEDPGLRAVGQVDEITLTNNGDGTVSVDLSDIYRVTMDIDEGLDGGQITFDASLTYENLVVLASGTAEATRYVYSADRIELSGADISGGTGPAPDIDVSVMLEGLAADYLLERSDDEIVVATSSLTLDTVTAAVAIEPPEGETGLAKFSLITADISNQSTTSFPAGAFAMENYDPNTPFPEDVAVSGSMDYGRVRSELNFVDTFQRIDLDYTNDGGRFAVGLSEDEFTYSFANTAPSVRAEGTDLPFPIEASAASTEFLIRLPLAATGEPAPAEAQIGLVDVAVPDNVWDMIEPDGVLSRDPLTVVLDLSGTVEIFMDMLDPGAFEVVAPPFEFRDVTLNDLRISAGGADLTGTGNVTFAPGGGMENPVGSVDLNLSGGLSLLDQLQNTGLIPLEQVAMARGLIGAFTRPGATPDTLESTIEFTEGGGITANGLPLQ
ncbi:MAG: DUF2125 domain-containing protein [Pseudomonadota bacterium]